MKTTNIVLLAGVIVTVGQWVKKKTLSLKIILGSAFVAMGLIGLEQINEKLSMQFAILILVASILIHGVPVFNAIVKGTK